MAQRDFNDIYVGLQDRIYRLSVGLVGGRDEAEDVVQALYERLWPKRAAITAQSNPEGYIMAAARNHCLDELRRRKRRPHAELSPSIAAEGERPDEGEMAEIVARLLAELPAGQRTVMRLRDVECMEMSEIALVTGMKETAVRMALSRARGTVKDKLANIISYGT